MITPEQLAKAGTEHAHQTALFAWSAINVGTHPELRWLFAIPNGGQRGDGTAKGAAIAGGRLKAEGVKAGVPDVMLPIRRSYWAGLFIEMKRPKSKGRAKGRFDRDPDSPQEQWRTYLLGAGYRHCICYTWNEASAEILRYLNEPINVVVNRQSS